MQQETLHEREHRWQEAENIRTTLCKQIQEASSCRHGPSTCQDGSLRMNLAASYPSTVSRQTIELSRETASSTSYASTTDHKRLCCANHAGYPRATVTRSRLANSQLLGSNMFSFAGCFWVSCSEEKRNSTSGAAYQGKRRWKGDWRLAARSCLSPGWRVSSTAGPGSVHKHAGCPGLLRQWEGREAWL